MKLDKQIDALKKSIELKKQKITPIKKDFKTKQVLNLLNNSYNLHVLNNNQLYTLRAFLQSLVNNSGVLLRDDNGSFSLYDYLYDIDIHIQNNNINTTKSQIKDLEKRLENAYSEQRKKEKEINNISDIINSL